VMRLGQRLQADAAAFEDGRLDLDHAGKVTARSGPCSPPRS
jgi:hypothetical protein